MNGLPISVRRSLRKLGRRLTLGLFLDIWPRWAVGSLLVAGLIALLCRLFFDGAARVLPWLWFAPLLAAIPVLIVCVRRVYRPAEIVALADSLSGGQGTLLTLAEIQDSAWSQTAGIARLSNLAMPRWKLKRRMAPLLPAAAFFLFVLMIPQRISTRPSDATLGSEIAADLATTLEELKNQDLITPDEEDKLEEEIERIRKTALDRVDASTWEAADALRERIAANLSEKQDALNWAEESVLRYAAVGLSGGPNSEAQAKELASAIEKLASLGLLSGAPEDLQKLFGGRDAVANGKVRLPADPESLRGLAESLSQYLAGRGERLGSTGASGRRFGRFDPSEYPLAGAGAGSFPGRGGVDRGRADAELTWGDESLPFDRFKAVALPPGAARSPDDWAPVTVLPGAPSESPELSEASAARTYAGTAGQPAWRRTLAPRHLSAVKKYFENSTPATKR